MSYKISNTSMRRLQETHPDLQKIVRELYQFMDISVLCGFRDKDDQDRAFLAGHSKLRYPQSKHNLEPALAVDIARYPINWEDIDGFNSMLDKVQEIADMHGIKIRLGRTFTFKDYPHVELI